MCVQKIHTGKYILNCTRYNDYLTFLSNWLVKSKFNQTLSSKLLYTIQ